MTPRRIRTDVPNIEVLEARLLLSEFGPSPLEAMGFTFFAEVTEVAPGAWRVAEGPPAELLRMPLLSNVNAADTSNADELWNGGALGLNLSGAGLAVGVWDQYHVRATHQEFGQRVAYGDPVTYWGEHATHVAGTIGAQGVVGAARGMANGVAIWSFDWTNDLAELGQAAGAINASNHSYTYYDGWEIIEGRDWWLADWNVFQEDPGFGKYDQTAADLDTVLAQNPDLLSIWAAGNHRDDHFTNTAGDNFYAAQHSGIGPYWYLLSAAIYPPPAQDGNGGTGYDCLTRAAVAKNNLVIGAVADILPDPYQSGDVVVSPYSSWGPTDDGRIKPDLVANGESLYSTWSAADNAYSILTGTSMAAPNATGTALLLIEHLVNVLGQVPSAATARSLLIHTAFDAGTAGPDYRYGWGLVDGAAAAVLVTATQEAVPHDWILENTYSGTEWTWDLYSDGTGPLKATIAWTDPAGVPQPPGLDIATPVLVNDLDLWVSGPGGAFHPWTLDPLNPANAAARSGANHVDNVEQVLIDSPSPGLYTIHVGHTGAVGAQDYSLIVRGAGEQSGAPTEADLQSASDSGLSAEDDLTNLDNSDAARLLLFDVLGTVPGATVRVYAGEVEIGSAVAAGGTTTVATNGTVGLGDGSHAITARQTEPGKYESPASEALTITIDTSSPAAPGAPDLAAGSDSGAHADDDVTNDDTPTLDLIGAMPYFRFYRDGQIISSDYELGTAFTTDTQADGEYAYTVTAVDAAGNESDPSPALSVTIDTTPPTVVEFGRDGRAGDPSWRRHPTELWKLKFAFSEDVSGSLDLNDLELYNLSTSQADSLANVTLSYDGQTETGTWDFAGRAPAAGWRRATLAAADVEDLAGNLLDGDGDGEGGDDYVYGESAPENDLLVPILGDADLDGDVDRNDLLILKAHFGQPGTWEDGDFNYNGYVDVLDYLGLKAHYGQSLTR